MIPRYIPRQGSAPFPWRDLLTWRVVLGLLGAVLVVLGFLILR